MNSASGAYSGENGQSGRNYQMLITANANLLTTIAMDEDYLSSLATIQTNPDFKDENGGDISNLVARRLTYRKLQEEPYLELNKRKMKMKILQTMWLINRAVFQALIKQM